MSQLEVDKIIPQSGTTLTIGDSGDTITFGTGTTPQLGGDLDLNSNDITGTGNINITGTATVSGDLTVDTDTLKVDSANNRVGIGTTSPSSALDVVGKGTFSGAGSFEALELITSDTNRVYVTGNSSVSGDMWRIGTSTSNPNLNIDGLQASSDILFRTGGTNERMRIDSSGKVGIGNSTPSSFVESSRFVVGSGTSGVNEMMFLYSGTNTFGALGFADGTSSTNRYRGMIGYDHNTDAMFISTAGGGSASRDVTVDNSGKLLVGKTSSGISNDGFEVQSTGQTIITQTSADVLRLNRKTSDGNIIDFRKDGTTVGSIGVASTYDLTIINSTAGLRFQADANFIHPCNSVGDDLDDTLDWGQVNARWDDIYATNATIQTSDQNEKQSIQSLTASEIAVAKRISKLFKTFKWNSAVEEKGDSARTHTGIIAQDVQQAFADEGLDASNYALFISGTWWEKEISVDAIAEELDEEGNIVVEGKDAYTYMDTKHEATEGYTERTRLGIRYPELLSFVSSAFEQRLTNIETRLTALET